MLEQLAGAGEIPLDGHTVAVSDAEQVASVGAACITGFLGQPHRKSHILFYAGAHPMEPSEIGTAFCRFAGFTGLLVQLERASPIPPNTRAVAVKIAEIAACNGIAEIARLRIQPGGLREVLVHATPELV